MSAKQGERSELMMLELRDEGMKPLDLGVNDFNEAFNLLKHYRETFTSAYLYSSDNMMLMAARRRIGSDEWRISYYADR